MPKPRNKQEGLQRETTAWEMRMLGHSEEEIAIKLGITQQAVSLILKRVYERKNAALEQTVAEAKVVVLNRLNWASKEAALAWEKSKKDAVQDKTATKRQGAKGADQPTDGLARERDAEDVEGGLYLDEDGEEIDPETRAERLRDAGRTDAEQQLAAALAASGFMLTTEEVHTKLVKGQTGNPAHLANVLKATQDTRDLLGLDAPKDAGNGISVVVKMYAEGTNVEDMV